MARRFGLESILAATAALFFGCTGCEGGTLNPGDDDDDTPEAPYDAEDLRNAPKCYDSNENLIELDVMTEGETVRCVFDAPDEFGGDVIISYSGLQDESISINESSLTATITPDMFDANKTPLATGETFELKEGQLELIYSVRNDHYVGGMDITLPFDVLVIGEAPNLLHPDVNMGMYEVGETVPGGNLLDISGATDDLDVLDGQNGYSNQSSCNGELLDPFGEQVFALNDCDFPEFPVTTWGEFILEYDVIDPQGNATPGVLRFGGYNLPTIGVDVFDFFPGANLGFGYVYIDCNNQGVDDFLFPASQQDEPFPLVNGSVDILIDSEAFKTGQASSIDCYLALVDEQSPSTMSDFADVIAHVNIDQDGNITDLTTGNPVQTIEGELIEAEPYDGAAQQATGALNTVHHFLLRQLGMIDVYGLTDTGEIIRMGNGGIISSQLVQGSQTWYDITRDDYLNNNPDLNMSGFNGDFIVDSGNGQIKIYLTSNAEIFDINRSVNGTTIQNCDLYIDDLYFTDPVAIGVGMLVCSGALSGASGEEAISNLNELTFSNGSGNPLKVGKLQAAIIQYYPRRRDQLCPSINGDNPCAGLMRNYDGDGPSEQ